MAGAIRSWGGQRGGGLAVMTQILGGILAGTEPVPRGFHGWGFYIQCFKPDLLMDPDLFRSRVTEFAETVRNAKPMPGVESVRMPFDGSRRSRARAELEGVEMVDALYQQVVALAEG
jgi:LDH2 family malate/lactate/ureidoglycolate dehydrogenase